MTDTSPLHSTGTFVGFGIAFLLFFIVWAIGLAFWIYCIVDVAHAPEAKFRAVGSDKTAWVLIVVLAGIIGALIWWFAKRAQVHAAPMLALPAPGWYPDAYAGGFRWWDGVRWTDAYQPPPGPPHHP